MYIYIYMYVRDTRKSSLKKLISYMKLISDIHVTLVYSPATWKLWAKFDFHRWNFIIRFLVPTPPTVNHTKMYKVFIPYGKRLGREVFGIQFHEIMRGISILFFSSHLEILTVNLIINFDSRGNSIFPRIILRCDTRVRIAGLKKETTHTHTYTWEKNQKSIIVKPIYLAHNWLLSPRGCDFLVMITNKPLIFSFRLSTSSIRRDTILGKVRHLACIEIFHTWSMLIHVHYPSQHRVGKLCNETDDYYFI